jgi:uncharacterized protein (UPF0332 family)
MIDKLAVDLCEYRLKKAKDMLVQAKLLFDNDKYDGSINRSFFKGKIFYKNLIFKWRINHE